MRNSVTRAIDEIDAAIFSGDEFIDDENIKELRRLMSRWERGLKEHEETIEELSKEEPVAYKNITEGTRVWRVLISL